MKRYTLALNSDLSPVFRRKDPDMNRTFKLGDIALISVIAACVAALAAPCGAAEDQTIVPPPGDYKMVEAVLEGGNLTLRGGIRDGKLMIPDSLSVRLKAGELVFTADAVKGEFGWRAPDKTQNQQALDAVIHRYAVDARIAGGAITGAWKSADGKRTSVVSGWVRTEKELQAANSFTRGKDWAFYHGSLSSFAAAPCGLTLVNDPKDFRLVWKSEELMPCGQGNGCHYLPGMLMCRTIGGGASPVVSADGKVYVNYMQPAGTVMNDQYRGAPALPQLEKLAKEWNTEVGPGVREKFLRDADDVIVCMDAATGKTLWKTVFAEKGRYQQGHKIGPVNNTPCVGDGKVFAMGSLGRIYALDAQTGKPLWEVPNITGIKLPAGFDRPHANAPVYIDGVVVMGNQGDTLHGFDARTGKELWKLPGKNNRLAVPSRWTHQGKDYILSPADKIYCIEPKSGKVAWETDYKGGYKGVAVSGDILVGLTFSQPGATECVAWRMTPEKAERIWATPVKASGDLSAPAVNDKYIAVGDPGEMQLLDLNTGKVLATAQGPGPGNEGHIFMAENLVFASTDGSHGHNTFGVYGATPETFKLLGGWSPPHHQTSSYHMKCLVFPVVEGRLFMRGFDGIYCYDLRKSPGRVRVEQAIQEAGADADAVITRLLSLATDADVQVREFAGRELAVRVAAGQANSRQAEVLPVLVRLMTGTDPQLRRQLALALVRLGEAALPALVESSRQPDVMARILVVEALGQMSSVDDPRTDQILLAALEETNMNLLEAALTGLAKRTAKLDLYQPVLVKLIDAAQWPVDRQAMVALLKILPKDTPPQPRPKKLEPLLVDLLAEYQDTALAYRAVDAIRALGDDEALRIFIGVLEGDSALRGLRVANGLAEMGARAKPALPALERAMAKWKGFGTFMRSARPAYKKIQEAK